MGIKSEPFRGVVLTGADIAKFKVQVRNHRPNKAAMATVKRGTKLAAEFQKNGYVVFRARKTTAKAV
jgi:hypothetical protein